MKMDRKKMLRIIIFSFVILTFFLTGCAIGQKGLLKRILENPELAVKLVEVRFCPGVTEEKIKEIEKDFHLKYMGNVTYSDDRYIMLILTIPRGSSVEKIIAQLKNDHQNIKSAAKYQEH